MASGHAAVPEGKDCMVCYDELSAETYAEYRVSKLDEGCTQEAGAPQGAWLPSNACSNCIEHMLGMQFKSYIDGVAKADCKAALRRYVQQGPPIWIHEPVAMVVGEREVVTELWYCATNTCKPAKLAGALEGAARHELWAEHRSIYDALTEDPPAAAS